MVFKRTLIGLVSTIGIEGWKDTLKGRKID